MIKFYIRWMIGCSVIVLCGFLFGGCISLSKRTPELVVLLGNNISESKLSHLALIDQWGEQRRERAEQFLEYRWIPTFIDNFMDPGGEPYKNLKTALKSDCRPVIADEIKEITSAISKQIEARRKELFGVIDEQVRTLKEAVGLHYAETERMHRAITANLNSVVKGQDFEKQIRDAMSKPLREIAPVGKASEMLDGLLK